MNGSNTFTFKFALTRMLLTAFLTGCATNQTPQPYEHLQLQTWLDVALDESLLGENQIALTSLPANADQLSYQEFARTIGSGKTEVITANFQKLDLYRRIGFYGGTAGALFSLIANKQGNIWGRTIGNGLWGIGWTCWLGFGALIRADARLFLEQHNESLQQTGSDSDGHDDPRAWAFLWRVREF